MTTLREAAQMALDWADNHGEVVFAGGGWNAVNPMNSWTRPLRAALAQPEQEPVTCHKCQGKGRIYMGCDSWIHCSVCNTTGKIHTAPPQQPELVIQARKEGNLIVVDLPQVPRGSGGITKDEQPEPRRE